MNILVHMPTRGRAEQAQKTISGYVTNCTDPARVSFSLACNSDSDLPGIENMFPQMPTVVRVEPFHSKIAAYNAIPTDIQWDVVLAASDDMWSIYQGWDKAIEEAMSTTFPDTNGCLWFSDGRQDRICTFSIMGRKAFEEDGFVYHPSYYSFFCDNEWTETWGTRQRLHSDPRCLFRNEHYAWGGVMQEDQTYRAGNTHWNRDKRNYHQRKIQGFPP